MSREEIGAALPVLPVPFVPFDPFGVMQFPGADQVLTLMVSSIFEAHQRTCLLTTEQIREQWEVGVQQSKVEDFMRMVGFRPIC